jgi:HK97 family phage major capsid protein
MQTLLPGAVLGYRSSGAPIFAIAGGATDNFDAWVPVEYSADVIQKVKQTSAVEAYGQEVLMSTNSRSTPRDAGSDIDHTAKGGSYQEDTNTNDQVTLTAQKFTRAYRIAEEDLNDSLANILNSKMNAWGTAYAKKLDNSCFGVTASKTTTGMAFDSLYYLLGQNNSATGYTANSNITQSAASPSYAEYNTTLGMYEAGDYFDEGESLVIAHPDFKQSLRGVLDSQNRPIFQESSVGFPGGGQGATPARLFGYPVKWSLGARLSATPTAKPTGHPIMIFCNPMYLLLGKRTTNPSNPAGTPEFQVIPPNISLTDEAVLKGRARRAFAPGVEQAFSILVDTSR